MRRQIKRRTVQAQILHLKRCIKVDKVNLDASHILAQSVITEAERKLIPTISSHISVGCHIKLISLIKYDISLF